MKFRIIALASMVASVLSYGSMAWAQTPSENAVKNGGKASAGDLAEASIPQINVACTGWHALCDAADDCTVVGDKANCACWRVKEQHIVVVSKITDTEVKGLTESVCTKGHPCDVDQAPVCSAIKSGQYTVDGVQYPWVSTYSYRGWCENFRPADCSGAKTGQWADCMTSPCEEIPNPADPQRPLSCQCVVKQSDFVGINGTCNPRGPDKVQSTFENGLWNFKANTYVVPPPGYKYVREACATLKSDPKK